MTNSLNSSVPALLKVIRDQYSLEWYGLHGVAHWARVYENGLRIASDSDANLEVLLLFALFHDSRRVNDAIDQGHGRRGADLAAEVRGRYFELPDDEFDLLYYACETHTDGLTEGDLTVQVCWDADRLDLARVRGFKPKPKRLCTEAARAPETIAWASDRARKTHIPELLSNEWGQKV
jgi:uncharacterized protein